MMVSRYSDILASDKPLVAASGSGVTGKGGSKVSDVATVADDVIVTADTATGAASVPLGALLVYLRFGLGSPGVVAAAAPVFVSVPSSGFFFARLVYLRFGLGSPGVPSAVVVVAAVFASPVFSSGFLRFTGVFRGFLGFASPSLVVFASAPLVLLASVSLAVVVLASPPTDLLASSPVVLLFPSAVDVSLSVSCSWLLFLAPFFLAAFSPFLLGMVSSSLRVLTLLRLRRALLPVFFFCLFLSFLFFLFTLSSTVNIHNKTFFHYGWLFVSKLLLD